MPRYTAKDGHVVKSRAELLIDNLLTDHQVNHEYEKAITLGTVTLHPDWYLLYQNVYIEFWGMEDHKRYRDKELEKLQLYSENQITVLSIKDKDLSDYKALEKRILNFVEKYSNKTKTQQLKYVGSRIGQKIKVRRQTIEVPELRQGKYCYFCLEPKTPDKRKPLCTSCYKRLQLKELCALCGKVFTTDEIPPSGNSFVVYVCDSCNDDYHNTCKICGESLDSPRQGKPLCYVCYARVSSASPGLPTPKWAKQARKRYYHDF